MKYITATEIKKQIEKVRIRDEKRHRAEGARRLNAIIKKLIKRLKNLKEESEG